MHRITLVSEAGRARGTAGLRWLVPGIWLALCARALAGPSITNVAVVNVTPSSFSVVCATGAAATQALSVFADPNGATSLSGQVGIEFYPLHTGDPTLTNAYDRRLGQAILRQKTMRQGLLHVRVSQCAPNTTYYYQLRITDPQGNQALWPAAPPLPAVTTARETPFVTQSRQLILSLSGIDPAGSIVILSNPQTASLLAAVAGDGVSSNQAYFNIDDLIAAASATHYVPLGDQEFTATVLGASTNVAPQTYSLNFTTDFVVGQAGEFSLGNYAFLSLGSAALRAGDAGAIPISLHAGGIANLTFALNLPTNHFGNLSLQAVSAQLGSASLQPVASNRLLLSFAAVPGKTLEGDQQIAQLYFTTLSNQSSAFVPLSPQSLQGLDVYGSNVVNLAVQPGRMVIVGREPLLEAFLAPGPARSLVLYGMPGASYQIQKSSNPGNPAAWSNLLRVPMTNLVETFSGLDTNRAVVFYRAYQFAADPPLLEAQLVDQNRSLLAYGIPGTNYLVQFATNLSGTVTWYPLMNYTLTNSFQFFTNLGNSNPRIFYRLKKP